MNLHVRQNPPPTTQAAEGLPRRAWTIAEIEEMVRAGIDKGAGDEIRPLALPGLAVRLSDLGLKPHAE